MRTTRQAVALICLAVLLCVSGAQAAVKLAGVLGSNMVFQQDKPIRLWGTAAAGERVSARMGDAVAVVVADDAGTWKLEFPALKAGGPYAILVTGADSEVKLDNVMIGEVWICSGQSNMAMGLSGCYNAEGEILEAYYPNIRLYTVTRVTSPEPKPDCGGSWLPCTPDSAKWFSGAAYFFGRKLHQELGVPVGLINTSWGGTAAEAWTSNEGLVAAGEFQPIFDRWAKIVEAYPEAMKQYNEVKVPEWQKAADAAKAEGKPAPAKPRAPEGPDSPNRPSNLYNAMINPLLNLPIRGAIWYQGESNAGRAYQYRTLFPTMIRDWRKQWGQGEFPFIFVQLANFMAVAPQPKESAWAELREAQSMTLSVPNTGQAVIIDIGEANDIHPKNKQDVGKRLALWALGTTYGQDIPYTGPMYDSMSIEGNRVRIYLKHTFGGLKTYADAPVNGFAIAGEDRKFVWADAVIDRDSIIVSSKEVSKPVAVRYGWGDNPVCNLYNTADLPATPFRTDDWPGVTINNK